MGKTTPIKMTSNPLEELIEKAPLFESDDSILCGNFVQAVLKDYNAEDPLEENIGRLWRRRKSALLDAIEYIQMNYKVNCFEISKLEKYEGVIGRKRLARIVCYKLRAFHQNTCHHCSIQYIPMLQKSQDEASSCLLCSIVRHDCASGVPSQIIKLMCHACSTTIYPPHTNCSMMMNESSDKDNVILEPTESEVVKSSCQFNISSSLPTHENITPHLSPSTPIRTSTPTQEKYHSCEIFEHANKAVELQKTEIKVNRSHSPPSNQFSSPSSPTNLSNTSVCTSFNPPKTPLNQPSTTNQSQVPTSQDICPFLKKGICRHGTWGLKNGRCRNYHPEPCEKFLRYGSVLPSGCDKGQSCNYYHLPFFCKNSIKYLWCTVENCQYFHHEFCSNFKPRLPPQPRSPSHSPAPSISSSPSNPSSYRTPLTRRPSPSPPTPFQSSPCVSNPSTVSLLPPTTTTPPISTIDTITNQTAPQPLTQPQNFVPLIPNFYPPPTHIPYHPILSYIPHHLIPQLVPMLEGLLLHMRKVMSN